MKRRIKARTFPSARVELKNKPRPHGTPQVESPSYALAFTDEEFLLHRKELRPMRLQLELMKPELLQRDAHIHSTVVIFGSARIPEQKEALKKLNQAKFAANRNLEDLHLKRRVTIAESILAKAHYYDEARKLARIISSICQDPSSRHFVVVTGGGPGIMEAANRGADDVNGKSIGLNIVLPMEQYPNPYITPELCFQFHYFAIRKMHFLIRAKALVAFPGGYGTLDELFETLTLLQTGKIKPVPIILFGKKFWSKIINFDALVEEGTIDPDDLDLFKYAETAEEAWEIICQFYRNDPLFKQSVDEQTLL
jgi:uncharacterized protein (TIGR00730 family)